MFIHNLSPDTASHARGWPLTTAPGSCPHRVFSSTEEWRLRRTRSSVQCSVGASEHRASCGEPANVPSRPDTQRIRRLEFNLLFIETQLEWEFEVRDGWMLDCSITWTNFMTLCFLCSANWFKLGVEAHFSTLINVWSSCWAVRTKLDFVCPKC